MLLIEFDPNLKYGYNNIIKYRDVEDSVYYYLYIDVETLHLLLLHFGILSTWIIPTEKNCLDNLTTTKNIKCTFCNAQIELYCGNNTLFNMNIMEQNY